MATKKYKEITKTAMELFKKHGIKRVTIEEICQTAGTSKMTFYKYFDNKMVLAQKIMEKLFDDNYELYLTLMKKPIPFKEKVEEVVRLKRELSQNFSKEFISDLLSSESEELKLFFHEKSQRIMTSFMEDIKKAQQTGEVRANIKPELMLFMLNQMMNMGDNEQIKAMYNSTSEMAVEITEFFFYGIMNR